MAFRWLCWLFSLCSLSSSLTIECDWQSAIDNPDFNLSPECENTMNSNGSVLDVRDEKHLRIWHEYREKVKFNFIVSIENSSIHRLYLGEIRLPVGPDFKIRVINNVDLSYVALPVKQKYHLEMRENDVLPYETMLFYKNNVALDPDLVRSIQCLTQDFHKPCQHVLGDLKITKDFPIPFRWNIYQIDGCLHLSSDLFFEDIRFLRNLQTLSTICKDPSIEQHIANEGNMCIPPHLFLRWTGNTSTQCVIPTEPTDIVVDGVIIPNNNFSRGPILTFWICCTLFILFLVFFVLFFVYGTRCFIQLGVIGDITKEMRRQIYNGALMSGHNYHVGRIVAPFMEDKYEDLVVSDRRIVERIYKSLKTILKQMMMLCIGRFILFSLTFMAFVLFGSQFVVCMILEVPFLGIHFS